MTKKKYQFKYLIIINLKVGLSAPNPDLLFVLSQKVSKKETSPALWAPSPMGEGKEE